MNVTAFEILQKYFNVSQSSFTKGKNNWAGPCPFHNETQGESLLIYEKQGKFDWVCMGKCHTGGEAAHMLVHGGIEKSIAQAEKRLREDFNLHLPEFVTLENYSEIKNISTDTLTANGIQNFTFYQDGQEVTGLLFPLMDEQGNTKAEKVRVKWEGKRRFFYHSGDLRWFGLQNLPNFDRNKPLYLCEGESDTLALLDRGKQAVGFLGSKGFRPDVASLAEFSTLVLCADNDPAGRELLKEASSHYSSTLYTVALGKYNDISEYLTYNNINSLEHFPAVPNLVSADWYSHEQMWRTLLAGKNTMEQLALAEQLKRAKHPARLINQAIKQYARPHQEEDCDTQEVSSEVFMRDGSYWRNRLVAGEWRADQLSNFTIRLRQTIQTDDGVVRVCSLIDHQGKESHPIYLTGELLANVPQFRAAIIAAGNFNWRGSAEDLSALVDLLQHQSAAIIKSPTLCGRFGSVWLMGKYGIDSQGQMVSANEDGTLDLDGEQYILRNINVLDEDDEASYPIQPADDFQSTELSWMASTLRDNLGGYEAYMALGFCVAGWHSDEIYRHRGEHNFPIFFIAGKRNSGKSVLANWLMGAYGFVGETMGKNWALPSVVSITRKLGYYSSLPQWYDDYRNGLRDADRRNQLLLSVYNRQGGDKGTRTGFGVRVEPVRASLLISGEDLPTDSAVLSRCTTIQVSAYKRDDELKQDAYQVAERLPAAGLYFLKDKQANGSKDLLERLSKIQRMLEQAGVDARMAKNRATFAAAFLHHWAEHITDEADFLSWLTMSSRDEVEATEMTHSVVEFMDELAEMIINGDLTHEKEFVIRTGSISIRLNLVYIALSRKTRQKSIISRNTLLSYLKLEPSYLSHETYTNIGGTRVRVLKLDIEKLPSELLQEACEAVSATEEF